MLLMGNSFFKPYAQRLSELAFDAELLEHTDTVFTRGGDNGTPIGLWNNEDTILISNKFLMLVTLICLA